MGKTISFVKGKGSITHNNRVFLADNVNKERMSWNIYYIQQPIKEAYDQLFGPAIAEYNAKQKRKDRWVTDYLSDIKNSGNNEKQFYETVVQIGRVEDTGVVGTDGGVSVDAEIAAKILDEYARTFQERNPNLYLFNAVLHMDEATPHLHLDYIPVAHGYKTKMQTRNSLTKALQEMGIEPATSKLDNETMHWQSREREFLMDLCKERGLDIDIIGEKRTNYAIHEYKVARQAADELNAELEILDAEKRETEAAIESLQSDAADSRDELEENGKRLAEIETEIKDRERKYAAYESKIDKVLAAEKPVRKELAEIRKRSKPSSSIFDSETYVKIPEKDFERVMDMAHASGTLEKLNEVYDKDIALMQDKINKLTTQNKTLKDRITQTEAFIKMKGFWEDLVEFFRPKSIQERIQENKRQIALEEATRSKREAKKDKGIAM